MLITVFGFFWATSIWISSFAFALNDVLFKKKIYIYRVIGALIIIITTVITSVAAYHFGWLGNQPKEDSIVVRSITIVGGIVSGIGGLIVSLIAASLSKKYRHLEFLRKWAIAVGCWGGTSFYNLDLSGVDFTGSKLANTDLRARKLYRTCMVSVTGLDRARVDDRYLDLTKPQVQKLLTHGCSEETDFSRINLQGAYLRFGDMRDFKLIETNLNGADLQGADLRRSILVRANACGVNFTGANLTGICIQDWSINSQTCFAQVECEYIYRKLDDKGEPIARYPIGRNFEPGEFAALFQEVENVVELVFKEGVNWRALSFTFRKFQLEDDGLGLELKGVEQRGDLWVVKVTYKQGIPQPQVEQRVNAIYDDLKNLLAVKEQQINKLLDISAAQAKALQKPFGNSFFIIGSTITNLAGSGQINYDEAASSIRTVVANGGDIIQGKTLAQSLLEQFQTQNVATSTEEQAELIEQVILTEAKKDPFFQQFVLQQGLKIAQALPESAIATAIQQAYSQLISPESTLPP